MKGWSDELKNIQFVQGDTVVILNKKFKKPDRNQALIIYPTHVLYQFTQVQKDEFYAMLERIGQIRDFYFSSVESLIAFGP